MAKFVRCLAPHCYRVFWSPDPKCIRICPLCRPMWERVRDGLDVPITWNDEIDDADTDEWEEIVDEAADGCTSEYTEPRLP